MDLTTPVRQSASHVVTIVNPLNSMVNFQTSCNVQDVNLPPQLTIPSLSEVCTAIIFYVCVRTYAHVYVYAMLCNGAPVFVFLCAPVDFSVRNSVEFCNLKK